MSIVSVLLILVLIGVGLWLFNTYVTMIDPKFKRLVNIVAVVATVLWLLVVFGVWDYAKQARVPKP